MTSKRGESLTLEQRQGLTDWINAESKEQVEAALGISRRRLNGWLQTGRIGHEYVPLLNRKLRELSLHVDNADRDTFRQIADMFESGRQLHFHKFMPQAAIAQLEQVVHHPQFHEMPVVPLFKQVIVILAIYRQSMYAADGHFLSCGRRCLQRLQLAGTALRGEEAAALITLLAWEMIAVVAQRGHAKAAAQHLETVWHTLSDFSLWNALPAGRERIVLRLLYWCNVIAHDNIEHAQSYFHRREEQFARLLQIDPRLKAEELNSLLTRFIHRSRFALSPRFQEQKDAEALFHGSLLPAFHHLHDLVSQNDVVGLNAYTTPSTGFSAAFHTTVFASHLKESNHLKLLDQAQSVVRWIRQTSGNSVMLQMANTETHSLVRAAHRSGDPFGKFFGSLEFIHDLYPSTVEQLLALAGQLLAFVPKCLGSQLIIRG